MTISFDDRPRPVKLAAVLYTPETSDRELLATFAAAMRSRGWQVGGLVQEIRRNADGSRAGVDAVDVAAGTRVTITLPAPKPGEDPVCTLDHPALINASGAVRRAIDANADLIVAEKFGEREQEGGGLADDILTAAAAGIPVLVSVPAAALESWLGFTGDMTELLPSNTAALWRWWGGGNLLEELIRGVEARPVNRVVIGLNWTLVESDTGAGIAHSPVKGSAGCRPIAGAGDLQNQSLRALAERARSWNPFDVALGIAAINANYNRYDLAGSDLNGLDTFAGTDGAVTAVGRFPALESRFEAVDVIELIPRDEEYPEIATERLLARSEAAVVTASSLVNGSLPRILGARGPSTRVALVGPGTPLAPALHAYGIESLSGIVFEDPPAVAKLITEGGSVSALKKLGRQVTLTANN